MGQEWLNICKFWIEASIWHFERRRMVLCGSVTSLLHILFRCYLGSFWFWREWFKRRNCSKKKKNKKNLWLRLWFLILVVLQYLLYLHLILLFVANFGGEILRKGSCEESSTKTCWKTYFGQIRSTRWTSWTVTSIIALTFEWKCWSSWRRRTSPKPTHSPRFLNFRRTTKSSSLSTPTVFPRTLAYFGIRKNIRICPSSTPCWWLPQPRLTFQRIGTKARNFATAEFTPTTLRWCYWTTYMSAIPPAFESVSW